jgi:ABC-2 type transport system permease protein
VTISVSRCPAAGCGQDPARISLAGLYLGQAMAALAGPTAIAAEYGTGMIRVSLAALVALLGLGVATAVRDAVVATGITLGLLYLFPVAASLAGDPTVARRLEQISPMFAGLDSQSTTGLGALPLTPWQGLGVVALWAAGALLIGWLVLRERDV